ncbi:MAG TPA: glycosyltransferase family 4 protein [Rariglobus sp.]
MKIAYTFHHDAANPAVQSGLPASSLSGLQRLGVSILPVFPLSTKPRKAYAKKIISRVTGKCYRTDREPAYLEAAASEFDIRTADKDYDFVCTPGSEIVGYLRTSKPITFCSDATFANMVDYYWDFTNLDPAYLRMGHKQEAAALARASLAVYSADWAAKSAINDYGADPAKVAVIPFGANIGKENTWPEVRRWIERRPRDEIRILFVGRHWERKGGDIVVEAAYCLAKLGHKVSVDIVGCPIPARHRALPWLRGHGLLSPRIAEHMARLHDLFTRAHFVFVPSRAEAYGMTFAEANAYGIPAISTNTGGIAGVVKNGYNGHLLGIDATPRDYADLIAASFANPAHYDRLCAQSFEAFARNHNWDAFCKRFVALAVERGLGPPPLEGARGTRFDAPPRATGRELFSAKEAWA